MGTMLSAGNNVPPEFWGCTAPPLDVSLLPTSERPTPGWWLRLHNLFCLFLETCIIIRLSQFSASAVLQPGPWQIPSICGFAK